MDCGKDEVILVKKRCAGVIARRVRWIKRKFGQEPLPARGRRSNLRKLKQVGFAEYRVFVNALEMRCIPAADQIELRRPACRVSAQHANRRLKVGPVFSRG